jgi:hypothetical protein
MSRKRRLKSAIKFSDFNVDYKLGDLVKHKDDGTVGLITEVRQIYLHGPRELFVYFHDGMLDIVPENYLEKVVES